MSDDNVTFALVTGAGATSFLWHPMVTELVLRGHRALPVELPGHGFDTVFPDGFGDPREDARFATSPSPLAKFTLDDYVDHTLGVLRRAAGHGPVVLVGHSLGGSTVTLVANSAPELVARVVYLSAYCCVDVPSVTAYAPSQPPQDSPLGRARRLAFAGNPAAIGALRMNVRTGDPEVIAAQHALLMADLDPAHVPAVLAYALQPDEPIQAIAGQAQVEERTWGGLPRTYIRTTEDEVIPLEVQDRMIAEADRLTPGNPFTVHTVAGSHFSPITRAAEIADILVAGEPQQVTR
ncbi:alpha/beta hydrolase [Amycolatopsis pigmentata]|uniref:Alpha/beta hydrolase n=1 Tax=Amycolatopsis pigmentata TaxID=450801 RepID=A0ABW5FP09_9PSEU